MRMNRPMILVLWVQPTVQQSPNVLPRPHSETVHPGGVDLGTGCGAGGWFGASWAESILISAVAASWAWDDGGEELPKEDGLDVLGATFLPTRAVITHHAGEWTR